jgi:hypothetical protein
MKQVAARARNVARLIGQDYSKQSHEWLSPPVDTEARTNRIASFSDAELPENPVQDVVGHHRADHLA